MKSTSASPALPASGTRPSATGWNLLVSVCACTVALGGCASGDSTDAGSGGSTADPVVGGPDPARFVTDALVSSEIVDCELADGTETRCYEIVTAGTQKASDPIGPFCPPTTSTSAEDAGIWLDGEALYQADGDFILNLPELYGTRYPGGDEVENAWIFHDRNGAVSITDTQEACEAAARPDVDPAYYNHCVECSLDYADGGVSMTFTIPVEPVPADEPGALGPEVGVSLSGFQIASRAPVEAILSSFTIAAFDDCGGHINPFDGYHFHAATGAEGCNGAGFEEDGHAALIGYALDGYGLYGQLDADGREPDGLDECRGHENDARGYHYHAASPEENMHIGCYTGKTTALERPGGPPPDGDRPR